MKRFVLSGLVASILMLMPFIGSAEFADGLVLYLPFDEGSGDIAADLSGLGHDGQIDLPEWVDGQFGGALSFAGAESGTFVTVESADDLNVNELTFMAWVRANTWDGTRQIVGKSVHGGCTGRTQYGLFSEGGGFTLRFETEAGRANINTDLPPASEWVHIAFTSDGAIATLFINGEVVAEGEVPGPLNANDDPLRIAQDCERTNYIFDGAIDEVRLWNRPLSDDEIREFKDLGVEALSGGTAVEPQDKLPTAWARIKAR